MKVRRGLGITAKLTIIFVLFAAALLVAVGGLAYTSGRAALESASTSALLSTALEKQAALDTWVGNGLSNITALANSPSVGEAMAFLTSPGPDSSAAQSAHDHLLRELQTLTAPGQPYRALLVLEAKTGQVLAATDAAQEGTFQEVQPFFVNGQNDPYVQNVYFSLEYQGPAMTVSAPLRAADGRLLGVLAGHLNLDGMNAITNRRAGPYQTQDAYLANTASLFVTQPRFVNDPAVLVQGVHTEAVQRCLAQASGVVLAPDYRGVPVIAAYRWLPERGMCLVVKVDQVEAFAPVQTLGQEIAVFSGLVLLVASVLAVRLARTFTGPVLALQAGAARFGAGDLGVRLPETSGDELGRLAGEFNRMAAAISEKETKLREHAEQLTQANKELEAFSYSVSHDLRAPLRAIDGFSRILLEDYAASLDSEAQRYLRIVRDNTQQMGHLIDDLLAFSRLSRQSLKMQSVAPADLVRQALAKLREEQDGRQVDILIGDLPACRGDPALLDQVFINLLGNALKYTRRRETARIEIGCQAADGENVYFVKDNGAGFEMQYAQKLFGVFQRLHRADEFEGTGVGLAIVQRIISRHGGRIWAEAAVDQGATFYFTLPAIEHAEPAPIVVEPDAIALRVSELV